MPPSPLGRKHTEKTIAILKEKNLGRNNPNFGKSPSLETLAKKAATVEANGGHPLKGKFGIANPSFGRTCTDKQKKLMSKMCKERKYAQVTCEHCGKTGSSQAMGRWHFDNCRSK